MPPVFLMAPPLLWLVRALALAAVSVSSWLTLQKWLGPRISLAGCGGSEGCATLLDSRWSLWFNTPVTLLAATLWLAVFLLTLPAAGRWLGRTADQLLAACAVLLLAGAAWFGILMLGVVKLWCPWCAAMHLAAILTGGILLHATWRKSQEGELGLFCVAGQAGIAGAALLVLGQVFGKAPETHLITVEASPAASPARSTEPGSVVFFNGTMAFNRREVPSIGASGALHVMAEFSDYTCPSCRTQHADLLALLKANPGTYAILILPTPLERSCNPHLEPGTQDHPQACSLAALALSLWKAAPQHFAAFHDYLMSTPLPLDPAAAREEAHRLVPTLTFPESESWITRQISANIATWHQLSSNNSKLPKLLLRDDIVLHGTTASRERFMEIISETFASRQPQPSPPPQRLLDAAESSIPVTTQPR